MQTWISHPSNIEDDVNVDADAEDIREAAGIAQCAATWLDQVVVGIRHEDNAICMPHRHLQIHNQSRNQETISNWTGVSQLFIKQKKEPF